MSNDPKVGALSGHARPVGMSRFLTKLGQSGAVARQDTLRVADMCDLAESEDVLSALLKQGLEENTRDVGGFKRVDCRGLAKFLIVRLKRFQNDPQP